MQGLPFSDACLRKIVVPAQAGTHAEPLEGATYESLRRAGARKNNAD